MTRSMIKAALRRLHLLKPVKRAAGRSAQHGHSLLVDLLPAIESASPAGYVIEIGSTREKLSGQGSTVVLAELSARLGLRFVTVDMDPANTEQARQDLSEFPNAEAVTAKGEDYLATFEGPVVGAYLDAFDIQHGQHSDYRIGRYREFLGTEITNEASASMHLECARALAGRVVAGGIVAVDDTWREAGGFGGKGATAVPYLLSEGFRIVKRTRTAVALRRTPRSADG